jgi:hypothetical protein
MSNTQAIQITSRAPACAAAIAMAAPSSRVKRLSNVADVAEGSSCGTPTHRDVDSPHALDDYEAQKYVHKEEWARR